MKKIILLLAVFACVSVSQAQTVTGIYGCYNKNGQYADLSTEPFYYRTSSYLSAMIYFRFEVTNGATELPVGEVITLSLNTFGDNGNYTYTLTSPLAANGKVVLQENLSFPIAQYQNALTWLESDQCYQGSCCATVAATTTLGTLDKNVADKCATFKILSNAAVKENALSNVNIYPTNVNGMLTIENLDNAQVSIYTISGQEVQSVNHAEGTISVDMSNLSNDLYLVKIQNQNGTRVEKIQVVK